jgi:hypothetical protein
MGTSWILDGHSLVADVAAVPIVFQRFLARTGKSVQHSRDILLKIF